MTTQTTDDVHALAESLAQRIADHNALRADGSANPVLAENLNGSFTLDIKYKQTDYELTVTIPEAAAGTKRQYTVALKTKKEGAADHVLGSFRYLDSGNWSVQVGLPAPVPFGHSNVSLEKLEFQFGSGHVS